jgi:hypothetical protein
MTGRAGKKAVRPNPITGLLGGWQPAQVLMAANHLDFFNAIGKRALSAGEVAKICKCQPSSTERLLNACVALGILEKEGSLYCNSPAALESLVRGKPNYLGDMIAHQEDLWEPWGKLHNAVRTNCPVTITHDASRGPDVHRNFILAMHNGALPDAPLLAEALDLSGRHQLFDVGGGPGTYSIFLVKRYPGLRAIVFDIPQTIPVAREIINQFGVADRVNARAGDYLKDDFGQGNDAVLLSRIFHSEGPECNRSLLAKAYASLIPGGLVAVRESLINEEGTSPIRAVLFSLNMLINTCEGKSYSASEIMSLMESVGFVEPAVIPVPMEASLIISKKP